MTHKPGVIHIEIGKNTVFFKKTVKTLFFVNLILRKCGNTLFLEKTIILNYSMI